MQWIKEVELVDSVDKLRSSSSTRGISMPNFEVLDARIASALNRIIHNSHFKRRISLEEQEAQKEDSFLRGRQIAYLIYDYFRVTGIHDSVENCADLFTLSPRTAIDLRADGDQVEIAVFSPARARHRGGADVGAPLNHATPRGVHVCALLLHVDASFADVRRPCRGRGAAVR